MKKYAEALRYLDSRVNYEKKGFKGDEEFGLAGMRAGLRKMSHPDRLYRSVHIAGTKGKGSVATFTSSILREAGLKVGLYTSPHLSSPRERIRLNGKMITKADLVKETLSLKKEIGGALSGKLTYFEIMTLLAIRYFASKKVDVAVFETGMGGRLDATNILKADVYAITPISYDHTHILGKSLGKIAKEKAAIIKKKSVCVSSFQKRDALKIIKDKCREVSVPLLLAGKEIKSVTRKITSEGTVFDITTPIKKYIDCRTFLKGGFQVENASVAAAVCEEIFRRLRRREISGSAVRKGIGKAFIAGRLEVLSKSPYTIIDGAQNAASCETLECSIRKIFSYRKLVLIAAFCEDKDIKGSCRALAKIADTIVVTRARTSRAAEPAKIAKYFPGKKVIITRDVKEALETASNLTKREDLILAAGSLYLAGEVREILKGKIF